MRAHDCRPCVFHVVPLGAPHPPHDCHVSAADDARVQVTCEPGYSGGDDQHFVLSLLSIVDGVQTPVVSNWSTDPGLILLTDLSPESSSPRLLSGRY